jgi:hypothetical protein
MVPPGHAKPAWRHEALGRPSQPPRARRLVPAVHSCLKFVIQQALRRDRRVIPIGRASTAPARCSYPLRPAETRGQVQRPEDRLDAHHLPARSPARGLVHSRPAPAAVDRPTRIRISREQLRPATYRPVSGIGEDVRMRPARRAALKPAVPDTCPGRASASSFVLVRGVHSNSLRSRERRFESYRGALVGDINSNTPTVLTPSQP